MRQYLAIIVTVTIVIVLLVAINAASYVEIEKAPDSELEPDRSTYNSGTTGTRALFDYLQESGYKVVRWREQPQRLLSAGNAVPGTFIVIGPTRVSFETEEVDDLLEWVESGGRLIVIDRTPDQRLLPSPGNWSMGLELQGYPTRDTGNTDPAAGISPARAAQPTIYTAGVDSVLASRFAATVKIFAAGGRMRDGGATHATAEDAGGNYRLSGKPSQVLSMGQEPPPAPVRQTSPDGNSSSETTEKEPAAPVVHLTESRGALLADYSYGDGRIIVLSDPFIIANNGISRADNLRLAINVVTGADGLIAFDEYHQGHAITHNELLAYFAGTPVLAMIGQLGLIVLVVVWTSGRRFARALPLPVVDRRSKLEFVASMAELQQRARAYDLAIENIYARTRRALARYAGVDGTEPRAEIAARVAARSQLNAPQLESLMRECEDAIAGEPISARQALNLASRLRDVERALGLRMRSREIKQAKER